MNNSDSLPSDHSAKVTAELRLKDSALNAAANAVFITDVDGIVQWVNQAASRLTGYRADEIIGRNPRELVKSGKHDQLFYKSLWNTILEKNIWHGEIVNRRKDGSLYHEDMTITPMLDDSGSITHFVAIKQDVTERVLMQQRISYSELVFRSLFEHISSGVVVYEATADGNDFTFKDINRSVERLENVQREQVIGKKLQDVFPAVKEFGIFDVLLRVNETGKPERFPVSFYQDRRIAGWRDNYVYRLPSGEVVAVYDDVTSVKQAEATIEQSHQLMFSLLDSMAEGAYGVDTDGVCTFVNKSFLRILGFANESEVIGQHIHELIHHSYADGSNYPAEQCKMYAAYQRREEIHCNDEVYWSKDGTPVQVEYRSRPIIVDDIVVGAVATFVDISERKVAEKKIHELAFYDPLTKLPNRRLLTDRLTRSMAASQRNAHHGALMVLDMDNFKSLNDTRGHLVGDLLLMEVARRLSACVRETDTVARFGGDEFVVMLDSLSVEAQSASTQALAVAEKIRVSLSEPYVLEEIRDNGESFAVEHRCAASIGVVVFWGNESKKDDILKWADAAMYGAKEGGRNTIRLHQMAAPCGPAFATGALRRR